MSQQVAKCSRCPAVYYYTQDIGKACAINYCRGTIQALVTSTEPRQNTGMAANDRQEGGDHYKTPGKIEHWDLVIMYGWDYFQGQITKYVMRWRKKGGIQDLKKARHFLDKYIESEEAKAALQASTNQQSASEPPSRGLS